MSLVSPKYFSHKINTKLTIDNLIYFSDENFDYPL